MFFELLFSFILILHQSLAYCPEGSIQGVNSGDCYKVFSSPLSWFAAEENCVANGGHLASISNTFQNNFIQTELQALFYNEKTVWIGGNTLYVPNTWTWSDNTAFTYSNWASGQPTGNQGLCTVFNWASGSWFSQNCVNLSLPSICKINGTQESRTSTTRSIGPTYTTNPCPSGYAYYGSTGYCYKKFEFNGGYNYNDSESRCNQDGGHLVSIHSNEENKWLGDIFSNTTCTGGTSCYWTGLLYQNNQWIWNDGTTVDYSNWIDENYNANDPCAIIVLSSNCFDYLKWEYEPCDIVDYGGFICKTKTN